MKSNLLQVRSDSLTERIVVTGLGVVSALGIGRKEFWKSIVGGSCACTEVEYMDTSDFKCHYGCEIKTLNLSEHFTHGDIDKYGKTSLYTMIAAREGLEDAGLSSSGICKEVGVTMGTGGGEMRSIEQYAETLTSRNSPSAIEFDRCAYERIARSVADECGLGGACTVINTACSAGNDAIIHACTQIKLKRQKIMLAGGADALSKIYFIGFSRLDALALKESTPFSSGRKGIMIGEGAAVVVLESYENAVSRGARIYGEILGWGASCDAYHMMAPDSSDNGGMSKCMRKALANASKPAEEIDYICAHGTGTVLNDKVETNAIKKVFGDRVYQIPISSIKSMIGHTGGAAGAFGAVTCLLAIDSGSIPPTINYTGGDSECDLFYVPNTSINKEINVALNNSFAFGGNNTALVIGRV